MKTMSFIYFLKTIQLFSIKMNFINLTVNLNLKDKLNNNLYLKKFLIIMII